MRKTSYIETENKICVDIVGLQALLSCGVVAAKQIADEANACFYIGRRRMYDVEKIKKHISEIGGKHHEKKQGYKGQ